jgi:hypothetical protein
MDEEALEKLVKRGDGTLVGGFFHKRVDAWQRQSELDH